MWVPTSELTANTAGWTVHATTKRRVAVGRVEKMSKSKRNTVDPEPIVAKYGADAVRWFMLSDSPPDRDLEWSESGIEGAWRFVQRVWRVVSSHSPPVSSSEVVDYAQCGGPSTLLRVRHRTIAGVARDIESLQFNKAVARLYAFLADIEKAPLAHDDDVKTLILLISPMAPHLGEECWQSLGYGGLVADASWPTYDPEMLIDDEVKIAVQVGGKVRDTIVVPTGSTEEANVAIALASSKVRAYVGEEEPRRIIYVPDRVINIIPARVTKPA